MSERVSAHESEETGEGDPERCQRGQLSLDEQSNDQGQDPLRQCRAERHGEEERCDENENAHTVSIGMDARKTSPIREDFPEGRGWICYGETRVQTP